MKRFAFLSQSGNGKANDDVEMQSEGCGTVRRPPGVTEAGDPSSSKIRGAAITGMQRIVLSRRGQGFSGGSATLGIGRNARECFGNGAWMRDLERAVPQSWCGFERGYFFPHNKRQRCCGSSSKPIAAKHGVVLCGDRWGGGFLNGGLHVEISKRKRRITYRRTSEV